MDIRIRGYTISVDTRAKTSEPCRVPDRIIIYILLRHTEGGVKVVLTLSRYELARAATGALVSF